MLPHQGVRHMTGETDRRRGLESVRQLLGWNLVPIRSCLIGKKERGLLTRPLDFTEWPLAVHAGLPAIPLGRDGAHQAGVRRFRDLRNAFLAAARLLRPSGTRRKPKLRSSHQTGPRGPSGLEPDRYRTARLRARDRPHSTKAAPP